MDSPLYPIFLAHLPPQQSVFPTLAPPTTTHSLLTDSFAFSSSLFYPNYLLGSCQLYQTVVSGSEGLAERAFCWPNQQWATAMILTQPSTKSLQSERESRTEQEEDDDCLRKEAEKKRSSKTGGEKWGKSKREAKKDRNYVPHRKEKKEVKRRPKENENRNIIPNEMNQILSFIQKRPKSGRLLQQLWAKHPPLHQACSISRFYLLQRHLKARVGLYGTQASFKLFNSLIEPECQVWSAQEQLYYIKLSRVLIGHFLREESIFAILTSKRMKREKKLEHLRARRLVADLVGKALEGT